MFRIVFASDANSFFFTHFGKIFLRFRRHRRRGLLLLHCIDFHYGVVCELVHTNGEEERFGGRARIV